MSERLNRNISWKKKEFSLPELMFYGLIISITLVLAVSINSEKKDSYQTALENYVTNSKLQSRLIATDVERQFKQIYQGIRTLARLPSIRNIDRYASNFEPNARTSALEIYKNLAENVALSEVYIVPVDFDPDRHDPNTGRLEEPIATFDHLIVGMHAGLGEFGKTPGDLKPHQTVHQVDEVEIYEYRLMREQIAHLKANFGSEKKIINQSYPAISGREVITCDNTRFSPSSPDDANRKGLVYSVPFYRPDGSLGGIISAVILTSAIKDMVSTGTAVIYNQLHDYKAGSGVSNKLPPHLSSINGSKPAASVLYSEIIDLPIPEVSGSWKMWVGSSDAIFWSRSDVKAAEEEARLKYLTLLIVTLVSFIFLRRAFSNQRHIVARSDELEALVKNRTNALRRAMQKSEAANKAKSTFLANMSHEIRTPISGIIGLSDILKQSRLGAEEAKKVGTINSSAEILLDLINDVLDISKIEAGRVESSSETFSVHALVDQCASMFSFQAYDKGLSLEYDVGENIPKYVRGDYKHLRQVLINLLGNALKFTDAGCIKIRVTRSQGQPGEKVELLFEIEDTGIGIEQSEQSKIFEPFTQLDQSEKRSFGGTGLGLSISRHLVKIMGGDLNCESKIGVGSRFTIRLPFSHAHEEQLVAEIETSSHKAGADWAFNPDVLIVEDNPVNLEIAKAYLEQLGCDIEVARNGREAIELSSRKQFDLVFMDCKMPGMDGFEATKMMRNGEKKSGAKPVPIVALTANAFREDKSRCMRAGMNDFLTKPFSARDLRAMLEKHLVTTVHEPADPV